MTNQLTTTRQERGQTIAQLNGQVKQIDDCLYIVKSQSNNGEYTVNRVNGELMCDCPDAMYRHVKCKHIFAVDFSQKLKAEVRKNVVIQEVNVSSCTFCHSANIKKFSVRKNKSGNIQRFLCEDCGKTFSVNLGFERMKHNPQAITSAMQLYFSGESLRNTMESLKLLGVEVSHQTVFNWIKKYVALMKNYADKLVPNVGDTWRADEIYLKVKGNMKYLFSMMDDQTRFWIAQEVADTKDKHDARNLLRMSQELMGKKPMTFITDGLHSYHVAYGKEWWTMKGPRTKHIRHITLKGNHNNNKMERMNGEIRDREKTMRGLKTTDTAILQGCQLYHNFIRPHEALDGKTPSEACGIAIEGKNKWLTLIQNACSSKTTQKK
ncbi:MAG: IS6 family transposase [Candidatus Bathyarchaeia archaeon]|jgi:transposase-like protein